MSILIQRIVTEPTYNINKLVEEIAAGVTKYLSVTGYNPITGVMNIEVADDWAGPDDIQLDAIINAHDPAPIPEDVKPLLIVYGGAGSPFIYNSGPGVDIKSRFILPKNGGHTKALLLFTNTGANYSRFVLTDITNAVELFDVQKVPDVAGVYEILTAYLTGLLPGPIVIELGIASGSPGTDAQLASILFT